MSYFKSLLQKNGLAKHDGRPLWKYTLNEQDVLDLLDEISSSDSKRKDPRDFTLYYSEWWRNSYSGGIPSKLIIFDSIEQLPYPYRSSSEFYEVAK